MPIKERAQPARPRGVQPARPRGVQPAEEGAACGARKGAARSRAPGDDGQPGAPPAAAHEPVAPPTGRLGELAAAAAGCTDCPLYANATQTVFGEGAAQSRVMLVGEQPGDAEDRAGRPFVGPAGRLLDAALVEAGVDRRTCYVTNAVKHFKWELRGKRRIHKTPAQREIEACSQWLEGELAAIDPDLVVCLGATAARAVLGPQARVGALRGRILSAPPPAPRAALERPPRAVLVTVHPSMILRAPPAERDAARAAFVDDLRRVAQYLMRPPSNPSPPLPPPLEGEGKGL